MRSNTSWGWETGEAWLESISRVVAFILLAMNRSASGLIARSFLETRYQDGTCFQVGASDGAPKHPGTMGFWATARARASVVSTSCRKFCGKAGGSIQMNPARYEGTRCLPSGGAGKCALMLWILSPSSGAYAAI